MKILFLGSLFDRKSEMEILRKSRINRISNAGNILQWNLINGMEENLGCPVDIMNCMPVGRYPKYYEDFRFRTKKWEHAPGADNLEIGSFNLPGFKELERAWGYRRGIRKWRKKNINEKKHVMIFTPYPPFFPALYRLPDDVNLSLIVADVPLLGLHETWRNRVTYNFIVRPLLKRINNFVLLTEQMTVPLEVGNRPYVVMEGIADTENRVCQPENHESGKKIIFYTGALQSQYGIDNLMDAFEHIKQPDYELWLCGWGSSEDDIIARSKKDPRIKYLGFVANDEVRRMQQQATLLINPRTDEGEFTKYSFPSKTLEYMLSGRPVLMYKLSGTPAEYDKYLYYMTEQDPAGIAARITEICGKPAGELESFGKKAQQFVMDNKNRVAQTAKILEMLSADKS